LNIKVLSQEKNIGATMKIIVILILSVVSTCIAQTNYMSIMKKDGTNILYPVSTVRLIKFSNNITKINEQKLANQVVNSFQLFQNYPNPFNPSTAIEYQIPNNGLVQINIFNIQGRLVRKLDNSVHKTGIQKIIWDGRDNYGMMVASGAYFCQVKFSGKAITKKLLLIK
jgi:hypothetical protein